MGVWPQLSRRQDHENQIKRNGKNEQSENSMKSKVRINTHKS